MLPTCRFVVGSSRYVAGHPEDLARLHDRDAWEPASLAEARRALGAYVLREDCYGLRPVYEACVGMIPQWAAQGEFLSLVLDAIGSASTESPGPTARLVVLRRRPETGRKKELSQAGAPAARPAPPAQPAPRREEEKVATWFEVLVVDDVGEPVPGIELDFAVGRPSGRVATSGSGVARVENADVHSGSVRLADVPAATPSCSPGRRSRRRSGPSPTSATTT
ncbi:MAG: hypothetical protein HY744_22780 [Deltaproteobacteria bacterium]|nr:hypothetical protein [Deltaproteobacteria bacterium]